MNSGSAMTKLKAVFLIDLIIVAAAAGAYIYLQNKGLIVGAPKPAEFIVTDLTVTPSEAEEAAPILISANITNIGDLEGTYDANLTINGVLTQTQIVTVPGNNTSVIVEFTVIEENIGEYTVEIGGLTGSFKIKEAPPSASNIHLSNPVVKTYEGKHTFKVNSISGTFTIVPTGYHTLTVNRSGGGSTPLTFTLNGVSHNTAYTEFLPVGGHTPSAPNIVHV